MSGETEAAILERLEALTAEIRELRERVAPAELPAEITVAQAMALTNHRCRRAFHYWCRRHRVRPIARGRYSRRRIESELAA